MKYFSFDQRLGIPVPNLQKDWDLYSAEQQQQILFEWEQIRGNIPDRIKQLEKLINESQEELNREENFERSCLLNCNIADLASVINDLWLYYRTQQDVSGMNMELHNSHPSHL